MNKMIRAVLALTSFALTSALFGVSLNLGALSQGQSIEIVVAGDYDGQFRLVNSDTNTEVAAGNFFVGWWPQPPYWGYGYSETPGVSVDVNGDIATISGIPEGNYHLELDAFGIGGTQYSGYSGGSGYAYFWGPYNFINFDFDVY
jgi:hypothetical protein